jgi:hypothetical protein
MADPMRALNRLCKWRTFFAGWQLGTRPPGDPECAAVRDQVDARLILRVEVNALTALLIQKGIFTEEEWDRAVETEAKALNRMLEDRYPGVRATDIGLEISNPEGVATLKAMNFKP